VQVASVATLWARAFRGEKIERPGADLVIVDEAHHIRAGTWSAIVESYPAAKVIGMTATACRGDGRGLGAAFDELVACADVEELVRLGHLVATKVYAPFDPDLSGVRTARGDWVESELAARLDRPKLVGDVVEHWHRLGEGRKTVVFATGVQHSVHIRDEFRRSGVAAEHIDGQTPADERDAILRGLAEGRVQLVSNAMVLTEGWDSPDVSCIILARPTKNLGLYRQMVGRVLRPAPGKVDALVLDHSGATLRHGFAEDPVAWTLDPDSRAVNARLAGLGGASPRSMATCPRCSAVRLEGDPCGACGWRPAARPRSIEVIDGDLSRLRRDYGRDAPDLDRLDFYRQLLGVAGERNYRSGWAAHKFKEKFGTWPPGHWSKTPERPSPAVLSWVRSRQIAYAKAQSAARGRP
jgi:superfamily II DNA or RNA helicase